MHPFSRIHLPMIAAIAAILCLGSIASRGTLAATAATPSINETCLACHGDKDAKRADGSSIAVEGAIFAQSVHGQMQLKCTDCHSDVSAQKLPHPEKLKPVACANCHQNEAKAYSVSEHGMARSAGKTTAATCTDCHGTHDIRPASDAASRTNHANIEATCGACHGNDVIVKKATLPGGNIVRQFADSIHGRALNGAARSAAPTCTNCHGAHGILPKSNPTSRTNRANIPDTCGSCHREEREKFANSLHGQLRQEGNAAAPVCTDCHTAHRIQQHELAQFQLAVIGDCGNCHEAHLSTYRDTFHGQITALGFTHVATCASCHGAHEILPASNPASMVSPQNRLATCQKCHAGASANFATFDPHADRHNKAHDRVYFYAALFMHWLLIGVFAFFGIHTVFWLYRSLRETLARGKRRHGGNQGGTP